MDQRNSGISVNPRSAATFHRCLKRYIVRELDPLILADLADSERAA